MAKVSKAGSLKQVFKEALTETFHEQREFLREVFAEAIEDVALFEAIREGQRTPRATREEVFRLFKGSA
jgi:hypothetical protein